MPPRSRIHRQLAGWLLIACCLGTAAQAQDTPEEVVTEFLAANHDGDVDAMVMLATPQHEGNIRSERWRDFWNGFEIREFRSVQYYQPSRQGQQADVTVVLEYSDQIMSRLHQRYAALPPGPDKEIYRRTIEKRGRREAQIAVIRIGDLWFWNHH